MDKVNNNLIKTVMCPECRKVEKLFTPLEVERGVPCWDCQRKRIGRRKK